MFRELRAWNAEIPASPDRMDPILRILLQLYANQLSQISGRVDRLWDVATSSLIRSVCPDASRWPVPAHTVMKAELIDPIAELDTNVRLVYKEQREGGQTFFFAPVRNETLASARVTNLLLQSEGSLLPVPGLSSTGQASASTGQPVSAAGARHLYLLIEWHGHAEDLAGATLFLRGQTEALQQLQWAKWLPLNGEGEFDRDAAMCPGAMDTIERMFAVDGRPRYWGSFRSSGTIFDDLRDNFVMFTPEFATALKPAEAHLTELSELGLQLTPSQDSSQHLFLFRLDLPPRGDRRALLQGLAADFGCFVATNRNELTLFKHTAGNRVVDIIIPEPLETVLEISRVIDSSGNEYIPRYNIGTDNSSHTYTVEERNGRLVLWFDFSAPQVKLPDSLTVNFSVTNGAAANSIEPGAITTLFESHPAVSEVVNVTSSKGAIPSKSEGEILTEVSTRVRARDRALTFADVADWSSTFDPRIIEVECEHGVQRTSSGVRRCIVVGVHVAERDFYSDVELELLRERLGAFLKSRSPVNVQYQVEIIRR
ncbi:hypothetical protein GF377_10260 [candidate division GN15 bacterium]|nr:hypothetical protein [candidate division GN15 bacterium]